MVADYYTILRVDASADFNALRKAYRRRAMECHPDRHGGDRRREEEFKRVVEAFDVLSDPLRRRDYDAQFVPTAGERPQAQVHFVEDEGAILDTFANDILEELIVGNTLPRGVTLATMMRDLESTQRFLMFREAKNLYYAGKVAVAEQLLQRYVLLAPSNILGHYYLARCHVLRSRWRDAERELATALRLGQQRMPPMPMGRVARELASVRRKQPGLLASIRRLFQPPVAHTDHLSPEERERRALNRAMNRMAARKPLPPA